MSMNLYDQFNGRIIAALNFTFSKSPEIYTLYSSLPAGHASTLSNSITPQVKADSHNGAGQEHSAHHKQADQQVQEGIKYGAVENEAKGQNTAGHIQGLIVTEDK